MITFQHVSYTYPEQPTPVLRNISLSLAEGTFTLVVGASGVGKSTLLRCINGLVPHFSGGTLVGDLCVDGHNPVYATPQVMSRHVGFVFQDPETQFVVDTVEDEIAFALENSAMPRQEMRVRVEEVLDLLDLAPLRARRLDTLSGGERQRVAIASALALRPHILVLDEPTSQLDPKSAEDVLHALERLNADIGLTIVLAEHRLERVLSFVDTVVFLPDGEAGAVIGTPHEIVHHMDLTPPLVTLGKALSWHPLPMTIKEGLRFARKEPRPESPSPKPLPPAQQAPTASDPTPLLQMHRVEMAYHNTPVLRGVDLAVRRGEVVALMGRNGSGKTTLLKSLVGLLRPRHGKVMLAGEDIARRETADVCKHVGYLPQDPNALLFAETVIEELEITLRNHGISPTTLSPMALLERLGLAAHATSYPRDLSAGERQRVALGAVAIPRPQALLLDEPTRGLDYLSKQRLTDLIRQWRGEGMAIVLVTHDVELTAAIADRVVVMSQGEIIADGPPSDVMSASPLFAPQVARLFPGTNWLTPDDVLAYRG